MLLSNNKCTDLKKPALTLPRSFGSVSAGFCAALSVAVLTGCVESANSKIARNASAEPAVAAQTNRAPKPQTNQAAPTKPATAKQNNNAMSPNKVKIETLVEKWFGGAAEVDSSRTPAYFVGSFDGDKNSDVAVILRLKVKPGAIGKDATVLNPWLAATEPDADKTDTESELALGIIHGSGKDWTTEEPAAKFILLDAVYEEMRLVTGSGENGTDLPDDAKGDGIFTGTETANGIIYWNGKTYRWEQISD